VIRYSIADTRNVKLVIYDPAGRRIKVLVDDTQGAGEYRVSWDGRTSSGARAPAGMYFIQLQAGTESWRKKAVYAP
jgi:flagellar hook assembly protein FlgD